MQCQRNYLEIDLLETGLENIMRHAPRDINHQNDELLLCLSQGLKISSTVVGTRAVP